MCLSAIPAFIYNSVTLKQFLCLQSSTGFISNVTEKNSALGLSECCQEVSLRGQSTSSVFSGDSPHQWKSLGQTNIEVSTSGKLGRIPAGGLPRCLTDRICEKGVLEKDILQEKTHS